METTKEDDKTESGTSDSQEKTARAKIRDLRPEKDPMGAGIKSAAQISGRLPAEH